MRRALLILALATMIAGSAALQAQTNPRPSRGVTPPPAVQLPYGGGFLAPTFDREGKRRSYPHGGWYQRRVYFYYPFAGFGTYGLYSWYYGAPYGTPYPYAYYYNQPLSPTYDLRFGNLSVRSVDGRMFYSWQPYAGSDRFDLTLAQARAWQQGYQAAREEERLRALERLWASVSLRVEPRQAAIYLDGNLIGTGADFARSGSVLRLPPGKYLLEAASPGYRSLSLELQPRPGEAVILDRKLEREEAPSDGKLGLPASAAPSGRLVLRIEPPEATVYLDRRLLGFAATAGEVKALETLRPGPHTVEVRRDGALSQRREVLVTPLRPTEVVLKLERTARD